MRLHGGGTCYKEQLEGMEEAIVLSDYQRERGIMIRSASRTADSISFCMKLPAAGSLSIPWGISISISRESVWRRLQYRMRVRPSNSEHRKILEAIRQGDGQAAEKAAYGHIANTIENLKNFDLEKVLREEMK